MVKKSRRWLGHVEYKNHTEWVKTCMMMEADEDLGRTVSRRIQSVGSPERMHRFGLNGEG